MTRLKLGDGSTHSPSMCKDNLKWCIDSSYLIDKYHCFMSNELCQQVCIVHQ